MGAQLGAAKGGINDINMTPLIDIVLVVLIIMMVNIPIQVEQMTIKLPATVENPPKSDVPPDQLVIAVYEDGTLALNRRLVTEDVLMYEIMRRLRPMENKNVFIDAHPVIAYGKVVDMMDLAREAGAAKVGLAKLKSTGPQPPTSVAPGSAPRGVTLGQPVVVGAMTGVQADEAIQPFMGNIRGCYTAALAANPTLNGRLMARVGVGPAGEILQHSISSSTLEGGEAVEACIDQVLPSLRFPALGGQNTAAVQYPLLFSPG